MVPELEWFCLILGSASSLFLLAVGVLVASWWYGDNRRDKVVSHAHLCPKAPKLLWAHKWVQLRKGGWSCQYCSEVTDEEWRIGLGTVQPTKPLPQPPPPPRDCERDGHEFEWTWTDPNAVTGEQSVGRTLWRCRHCRVERGREAAVKKPNPTPETPLPCPKCGDATLKAQVIASPNTEGVGYYFVGCPMPECAFCGPRRPSRLTAISAWNRQCREKVEKPVFYYKLPCPKCQSPSVVPRIRGSVVANWCWVECQAGGCNYHGSGARTINKAVQAWNRESTGEGEPEPPPRIAHCGHCGAAIAYETWPSKRQVRNEECIQRSKPIWVRWFTCPSCGGLGPQMSKRTLEPSEYEAACEAVERTGCGKVFPANTTPEAPMELEQAFAVAEWTALVNNAKRIAPERPATSEEVAALNAAWEKLQTGSRSTGKANTITNLEIEGGRLELSSNPTREYLTFPERMSDAEKRQLTEAWRKPPTDLPPFEPGVAHVLAPHGWTGRFPPTKPSRPSGCQICGDNRLREVIPTPQPTKLPKRIAQDLHEATVRCGGGVYRVWRCMGCGRTGVLLLNAGRALQAWCFPPKKSRLRRWWNKHPNWHKGMRALRRAGKRLERQMAKEAKADKRERVAFRERSELWDTREKVAMVRDMLRGVPKQDWPTKQAMRHVCKVVTPRKMRKWKRQGWVPD